MLFCYAEAYYELRGHFRPIDASELHISFLQLVIWNFAPGLTAWELNLKRHYIARNWNIYDWDSNKCLRRAQKFILTRLCRFFSIGEALDYFFFVLHIVNDFCPHWTEESNKIWLHWNVWVWLICWQLTLFQFDFNSIATCQFQLKLQISIKTANFN